MRYRDRLTVLAVAVSAGAFSLATVNCQTSTAPTLPELPTATTTPTHVPMTSTAIWYSTPVDTRVRETVPVVLPTQTQPTRPMTALTTSPSESSSTNLRTSATSLPVTEQPVSPVPTAEPTADTFPSAPTHSPTPVPSQDVLSVQESESLSGYEVWTDDQFFHLTDRHLTHGSMGANGNFPVSWTVYQSVNNQIFNTPDASQLPVFQVTCKPTGSLPRKCAEDWAITLDSPQLNTFTLNLPPGWSEVTLSHEDVPLIRTFVNVSPHYLLPNHNPAEVVIETAGTFADVFATNATAPANPVDLVPRVLGYWSDGSADIEIFAGIQTVKPTDTLRCTTVNDPSFACPAQMSPTSSGRYTRIQTRMSFGTTNLKVIRNDETVLDANITVPERMLGVDADVLDCFTDMSVADAGFSLTGCGAWYDPVVTKWDSAQPIRVKLSGPDPWKDFFVDTLTEIEPLLNVGFEWVQGDQEGDVLAVVGITREDALERDLACSIEPITAGCASNGISIDTAGGLDNHIIIYNRYPSNSDELPKTSRGLSQLRATILHESVHAFVGMIHRTNPGSIMHSNHSEFFSERLDLSPMDHALVNIQAHPAIKHGMSLHDVRRIAITQDELLDPDPVALEPAPGFLAWKTVNSAFHRIREAANARYTLSTTMPGCEQQLSAATYQVAKLLPKHRHFQWAHIAFEDASQFHIETNSPDPELWELRDSSWQLSEQQAIQSGWIPELSDPYNLLVDLLLRADWGKVSLSNQDGKSVIYASNDAFPDGDDRQSLRLTIDPSTNIITDYEVNWFLNNLDCTAYIAKATDGTYSNQFAFPPDVQTRSDFLSDCELHELPRNPRAHRIDGRWHRECPTDTIDATFAETYRFNTETWSLLRLDFQTQDDAFLSLTDLSSDEVHTLEPQTGGVYLDSSNVSGQLPEHGHNLVQWHFPLGLEGYGRNILDIDPFQFQHPAHGSYVWHHQWLPPGSYELQASTKQTSFAGRFTLIIDAQPIPGPPQYLRFKAVATSTDRTCALLTDGSPLCWGRPRDTNHNPTVPDGKFDRIFGGFHYCATVSDGTPQCWDFREHGHHFCGETAGLTSGRLCHTTNEPDPTNDGLIDKSVIAVPGLFYDQTPPTGEQFIALAPALDNTCAVRADYSTICWGSDEIGESSPPDGNLFADITGGWGFSCGITSDDQTICWGDSYFPGATPPFSGLADIGTDFSADYSRICGIDDQQTIQCYGIPITCAVIGSVASACWKERIDGQSMTFNPAPDSTFIALSTEAPECGIKVDGTAECWHPWVYGSPPPSETFTQISAGNRHICGLRTDGTIACWGDNFYGQSTPPNGTYLTDRR